MPITPIVAGTNKNDPNATTGPQLAERVNAVFLQADATDAAVAAIAEDVAENSSALSANAAAIEATESDITGIKTKIGTDPAIIQSSSIHLSGLPQTAGAPAGYGDVADTVNAVYLESGLDKVMAFEPQQWGGWVATSSYGGSVYGCRSADPLNIYTSGIDLQQSVLGNPVPATGTGSLNIRYVIALDNQTILAFVEDGDLRYRMYRTADAGGTWSLVLTAEHTHVKPLSDRCILKATVAGQVVVYYAEYNFNPLAGGITAESKLVLWKSLDYGATWAPAVTWNTDGVNNTRHMHAIKQFEQNGPIYVCFGDTDAQSAIVKWDGVTAWPSNTSWRDIVQSEGLKVYHGRQSARAVDLVESDGRVYYLNDTYSSFRGDATEQAVWSFGQSFDDFTNESQPMSVVKEHAGWLAAKDSEGRVFFISAPDATAIAGSKFVGIIGSNKTKTDFKLAGAFRVLDNATSSVPYGFFFNNGSLFLSATNGSGKGANNTVSFKLSEYPFRGDYETRHIPDTIHPVYWCNYAGGNDVNSGVNPNLAVADIRALIAGDKVPYGARVQLMQNNNLFTGTTLVWKSNSVAAGFQGDLTEPVSVYGNGATKSSLVYAADGPITTSVVSASGVNGMRGRFVDLSIYTLKPLRLFDVSQSSGQNNAMSFVRCILGSPTTISSATIRASNAPVALYGTILGFNKDSHTIVTTLAPADLLNLTLDSCLMLSASTHFNVTNEATANAIRLYNSKFMGYSTACINCTGAASVTLSGWDNVMSTTFATNNGAVIGGGTVTGKLQNTTVRGVVNNATAFADNCKLGLYPVYDFKYSDYVN